ncbi:hypothetical protein ACFFLS_05085 [Flavobacterium procerum]|uniref:DUF3828 domain-containing protein n=1 Tax=Flavobacterium procerum TaxID=1455569 RepID=A0ABV6BLT0_9FLAO
MIKQLLCFGLLFFSFTIEAQSSMGERRVTLDKQFSIDVLNAYQENSKSKIEDLFSYFQMLTDVNLDNQLKSQIAKNIYSLYKNENELVIDFTSNNFEKIPLKQFIQKLSNSHSIFFKVSDEAQYNSVAYNFWKTNYTISITKAGTTARQKVIQKVYFDEKNKNFGSNNKFVYETHLGEME